MMKKTGQRLMMLVVLWACTGAAQARDLFKNAQADFFVLGGGSTLVDPQSWESTGRLFHSRFTPHAKFTIGVAIPYGKLLSIETGYTYGPSDWVVTNINIFPHSAGTMTYPLRAYNGSLSAVVHAPFSHFHFHPYGEVGVEYDRFSPTPAAVTLAEDKGFSTVSTAIIAHNDKFGMNIGAGLDRKLTKRITFRIDLRDHVTGSPAFGLPQQPTEDSPANYPVKGRAHDLVYTAGILIHFGKR